MELGYHVLLEKPIAKTLKEALELREMFAAWARIRRILPSLPDFVRT